MVRLSFTALAVTTLLSHNAASISTWPSATDELEDIMYLNTGYRARGYAADVTPCSKGAGTGRIAAAERIRTAFHDMATGNVNTGVGGLDASIQFEVNSSDNPGPGFPTTLNTNVPFFSSRSSMADLIALGVYTSVRSCGGPIVSMRGGRIDATEAGFTGVPQPQNSQFTLKNQFLRIGFNTEEMIALVACGHTLGAVHSVNFPQIVPASTPGGYKSMDSTGVDNPAFDSKIAQEYVAGTQQDPLVYGPSIASGRNSDFKVFTADSNQTITKMADPTYFKNQCATLLQRMVEVKPAADPGLSDIIVPYDVKPFALQLGLVDGGAQITFTGEVRVRTTTRAASQISNVQLKYKDRTGAAGGSIDTAVKGTASGFDDTFTFFSFSSRISSTSSISSFTVVVTLSNGNIETYDNNGAGYPIDDTVFALKPQSCLSGNKITIAAAVRNTVSAPSASFDLTLKVPRTDGVVVPQLQKNSVPMTQAGTSGPYTLFSGSYTGDTTQLKGSRFDVLAGTGGDKFKDAGGLTDTCAAPPLDTSTSSTLMTSTSSTTSSISTTSSTSTLITSTISSTTSSTSSGPAEPTFSGYSYQGCFTDNTSGRVLTGRNTASSKMTYSSCASFCSSYNYFGLEYASECFCGNSFTNPTTMVKESECSLSCAGDASQSTKCGAGNRLTIFKDLSPPAPAPSASTISGYTYLGCYTDNTSGRVLNAGPALFSNSMTLEKCAVYCKDHEYFGGEYGEECWCGDSFANPTKSAPEGECNYVCAGNSKELCGAGNRLSIYQKNAV